MAARKKKSSRGAGGWFIWLVLLLVGFAGGYAVAIYAPLPEKFAVVNDNSPDDEFEQELSASNERLTEAQNEVRRLREQLLEVEQIQERAEEDLADIQIKSLLVEN